MICERSKAERLSTERVTLAENGRVALGAKSIECREISRAFVSVEVLIATLLRLSISTESLAGRAKSGLLAGLAIAALAGLSIATLARLTIATLAESTFDILALKALGLEAAEAALAAIKATAAIATAIALARALYRSLSGSTISTEAALEGAGVAAEAVVATADLFGGGTITIASTRG